MELDDCKEHRIDDAQVLNREEHLGVDSQSQTDRAVRSPSPALSGYSTPQKKGSVLKKWKRIRRDVSRDSKTPLDTSNRILKRNLSAPSHPMKGRQDSKLGFSPLSDPINGRQETKPNSEESVGSASVSKNLPSTYGLPLQGLGLDSRFSIGSAFSVGTDSENSEERSSKSSTAASVPKSRYDPHIGLGSTCDKNRVKNMNTKSLGSSALHIKQAKGPSETGKKTRGEIFPFERENSYSSVESDSRSSNFKPVVFTASSNGNYVKYNGDNSDEAHTNECCSGENQAGFPKGHVGDCENIRQHDQAGEVSSDGKESRRENQDPLIDSIRCLQCLQEALEQELRKFGEIGNESLSPDSININNLAAGSSSLETEKPKVQNVENLESKLEEARAIIALRNSKLAELETFVASLKFAKETSSGKFGLQDEQCREMEVEALFKKRIESEIECLVITNTIQNSKITVCAQPVLLKEQELLAREQIKMPDKLGEADSRRSMLIKKKDDSENNCNDVLGTEESNKMQRSIYKISVRFSLQLLLFILVLWHFMLKLSPNPEVVVPT